MKLVALLLDSALVLEAGVRKSYVRLVVVRPATPGLEEVLCRPHLSLCVGALPYLASWRCVHWP